MNRRRQESGDNPGERWRLATKFLESVHGFYRDLWSGLRLEGIHKSEKILKAEPQKD